MDNTCISCGITIHEGRSHCPNCEHGEKVSMEWRQVSFCDWEAKGRFGDFRIWKDGRVWKGRYRSADEQKLFFLPVQKSEKKMKKVCEENNYWE